MEGNRFEGYNGHNENTSEQSQDLSAKLEISTELPEFEDKAVDLSIGDLKNRIEKNPNREALESDVDRLFPIAQAYVEYFVKLFEYAKAHGDLPESESSKEVFLQDMQINIKRMCVQFAGETKGNAVYVRLLRYLGVDPLQIYIGHIEAES